MHRGHFNASTVARQHSRASWVEFQEEAEKLREFTKEVLEQELVWGDDGNSE